MAPVKVLVGRLVFFFMKILDYLLSFTGIKLVPVNLQSVLRGLSPEELEESRDPTIAGLLGLFVDCVEKARPEHLDVVGRILFKETLRDILRKRVGIKKTLAEHPDILQVSEPFRHLTKKKNLCTHSQALWWSRDDGMAWKHFPRYWPCVREILRCPMDSRHKRPVTRSFDILLDISWTCGWTNSGVVGNLRRSDSHVTSLM